jgi:PleD family two-component response regulator
MAQILIFKGTGGHSPLRNSLQEYHKLYFAHNIPDAMKVLHKKEIDLIICSVYDDSTDPFAFLKIVKQDLISSGTPVLFFSKERTFLASALDATMARSALLCGADKYLTMDSFCGARRETDACKTCPYLGEKCNYNDLRQVIEDMLRTKSLAHISNKESVRPAVGTK